ncbi:MAG: RdgB/HAM1 family non-canonical purine NTP pyrophosphatase [Chloroflexi bacterium]|nr:RdgB/HAM1 family non-canonical purine NTP pyrophosphatase [Chloroflexota bacterium]
MPDAPARTLVIATNNAGKVRELQPLLADAGFALTTPRELGIPFDPEETGATFAENATIKAVEAARSTGFLALADDSGLEIDALGLRPGIFSARYAGKDRTDPDISEEEQVRLILQEMEPVPEGERTARFRCVIAIAAPDGAVRTTEGVFEGRITRAPRGTNGFGYDPIFEVPGRGLTSAELDPEEKNRISHRGQAARKAVAILQEIARDGGERTQR